MLFVGALNHRSEKRFANIGDWQEEIYQKVMSSKYLVLLVDFFPLEPFIGKHSLWLCK